MILQDLHNHTYFSYDSELMPEDIIENAILNKIDIIGISDHQFSIKSDIFKYTKKLEELKEKYKGKIDVKCGIEIGTRPMPNDLILSSVENLDYCLFESLDDLRSLDFYEFMQWVKLFKMRVGFAHTDIFKLEEHYNFDILSYMRENNIFWEINTSGNYTYYYDFLTNPEKQKKVSKSGIEISIGSDTHTLTGFNINKLKSCHELLLKLGNPIIFS